MISFGRSLEDFRCQKYVMRNRAQHPSYYLYGCDINVVSVTNLLRSGLSNPLVVTLVPVNKDIRILNQAKQSK